VSAVSSCLVTISKLMKSAITSAVLIKRLPLVDENILAEAAKQPMLFIDAARYRVAKMRSRLKSEATLEYATAAVALKIRVRRADGEKLTEGAVKAKVAKNLSLRTLRTACDDSTAREEFSKLILEAYRMRRDGIRIIADAHNYEGVKESSELQRIETRRKMVKRARALEEKRLSLHED
jgi:hypothetical protein